MRPRRFLPSLSLLLAFEAVMRSGSVTTAARELNLTQSTVSRLIQRLEVQLGQELFVRQRKRLIPTGAALAYHRDIARALDIVQRSTTALVTNPGGGTLSLATLPTFGSRWLGPRLVRFLEENPGISVNLSTRLHRFSFETEPFDAVIYFGDDDWPGTEQMTLFDEYLTACASPEFLKRHPIEGVPDMEGLPLLRLETRLGAWDVWFRGQPGGAEAPPRTSGMVIDQFSMMIQAAISGLGIALLPDYLARTEIQEKRLNPVLKPAIPGSGSYRLAWPPEKANDPALAAFRRWVGHSAEGA